MRPPESTGTHSSRHPSVFVRTSREHPRKVKLLLRSPQPLSGKGEPSGPQQHRQDPGPLSPCSVARPWPHGPPWPTQNPLTPMSRVHEVQGALASPCCQRCSPCTPSGSPRSGRGAGSAHPCPALQPWSWAVCCSPWGQEHGRGHRGLCCWRESCRLQEAAEKRVSPARAGSRPGPTWP